MAAPVSYRSIFWHESWVHTAYYGWENIRRKDNFVVHRQSRMGLLRYLVLVENTSEEELSELMHSLHLPYWRCEIVVHDFSMPSPTNRVLDGKNYTPLGDNGRLLNIATLVHDLSKPSAEIFAGMDSDPRRRCRKSIEAGATFSVSDTDAGLEWFVEHHDKLAQERGLQKLVPAVLRSMFSNRNLLRYSAQLGDKARSEALIYLAGPTAYCLLLVASGHGVAQFLQWGIIQDLQARAFKWYDWGGVQVESESHGIYHFKLSFGGEFVSLGSETLYRSNLLVFLRWLWRRLTVYMQGSVSTKVA